MSLNLAKTTDSYKCSHYLQFPPNTKKLFYYLESRSKNERIVVLYRPILHRFLKVPTKDEVYEAKSFWDSHGFKDIFNLDGWLKISKLGYLPIRIKAVDEGTILPTQNVFMTVENTIDEFFWLPGWIETLLLQCWYPITVCTRSFEIRQIIKRYLELTGDVSSLDFKLHDFGFRGVSSYESAKIGGLAHLVNFCGTDTTAAIDGIKEYYDDDYSYMPGFSIPAAEHSTITSWGKQNEEKAYENMLNQFAKPGKIVAVVSDSYDLDHAVDYIWGQKLRNKIVDSGAIIVIRPDSGEPKEVVVRTLLKLSEKFGFSVNSKGYKVLNHVRVIQGDGISSPNSVDEILTNVIKNNFSADNISFGMGGGLLQQVNRDTYKFAMKCSARYDGKKWCDVYKEPKDDPSKNSKRGVLKLIKNHGRFETIKNNSNNNKNMLVPVFENGTLITESFAHIREFVRFQEQKL